MDSKRRIVLRQLRQHCSGHSLSRTELLHQMQLCKFVACCGLSGFGSEVLQCICSIDSRSKCPNWAAVAINESGSARIAFDEGRVQQRQCHLNGHETIIANVAGWLLWGNDDAGDLWSKLGF